MKRFIAIFMTLCLVLGMSSVNAWADEVSKWNKVSSNSNSGRSGAAIATVGDEIYIISGEFEGQTVKNVDIYNTKTKKWRTGAPIPSIAIYPCVSVIKDKIYVFNGSGNDMLQIYDTKTDAWADGTKTPFASMGSMSSMVNGKIYVIGGRQGADGFKNNLCIYDVSTDQWSSGANLPISIQSGVAVSAGNRLYVIGGQGNISSKGATNSVQIYDIETNKWTIGTPMPTKRSYAMASVLGDDIYVIGGATGENGSAIKDVEIYTMTTDSWSSGPSLQYSRIGGGAVVVDQKIYIAAGRLNNIIECLQIVKHTPMNVLSVLLNIGEDVQLSTSYHLDNNKNFTWSSTNEEVATVDSNGKVTALAEGTTDIYAQNADGTFKEYIPVKVVEGIADELRLAVHLKSGEKAKLYLTDEPSQVTWSSMDDSTVTVSADGQITGVKKGLAIVQAELDGETYQIYVRVNG